MKKGNLRLVVRTALLLAIMLVFQQLRLLIGNGLASTVVIGSLVNLCLVVAAATVGWRGSLVLAVLSPVAALLEGHLPLPVLIPFVAAGNFAISGVFEWVERHKNTQPRLWTGVAAAALAKTACLYALVVLLFVGAILPGMGLPAQKAGVLSGALALSFGWPQLVTALIGGAVAVPVIRRLRMVFPET
jgi:hypothetical protein